MLNVDGLFSPKNAEEPRKKLIDFSKSSQMSKITNLERLHLSAALKLSEEDFKGALSIFENIIALYPRDTYAMHMAYFIGKSDNSIIITVLVVRHLRQNASAKHTNTS